jgi:hypothetical protein
VYFAFSERVTSFSLHSWWGMESYRTAHFDEGPLGSTEPATILEDPLATKSVKAWVIVIVPHPRIGLHINTMQAARHILLF